MTTISPISTAVNATSVSGSGSGSAASAISSDFQTFLRMLTTQMQNQDPLNPMESTEFATQLATFSGVEQQLRTNSWLEQIASQSSGLTGLAQMIGMEAEVTSDVWFTGAETPLTFDVPSAAQSAELVVRDSSGYILARTGLAPGETTHTWSGKTQDGTMLPPGRYNLTIETIYPDRSGEQLPVYHYDRIEEIRQTADGGHSYVLKGGVEISRDSISALRDGNL